ncbi:MAG: MmgE/PrpD family protein [Chloroflexi bacterium]|nr:MmgE/PrpD family protein [Chloroflexota bacterium]
MKQVEHLASFVTRSTYQDLSEQARNQLKIRLLDALGCAFGALHGEPIRLIAQQLEDFGGATHCTIIGGGRSAPDRAAFYNSALVRYLDFNDSYLAKGETCHPSDNLGAVLAAAEYADVTGEEFLTALAVAYQVQCRLSDAAPVRARGFDHTTQGAYALAAGVSKALHLDVNRTANAIAISGTSYNSLRVTRTGALSNWKGLAYPNTAFGATHATFLAMRGITGPLEVFEGNKGFMEAISGKFELDWEKEDLERVRKTIVKKFNAEVHSQAVLEGILELEQEHPFTGEEVRNIEVEIFDVAYNIIGGGEEGEKVTVRTKEEADHSLPYMIAAAILDGQVMPAQYLPERIQKDDIQSLLRKILIRPDEAFSRRFPQEMPCRIRVKLADGRSLVKEKSDYEGFITRPPNWETVEAKFNTLSAPFISQTLQRQIIAAVKDLDSIEITDLTRLLSNGEP